MQPIDHDIRLHMRLSASTDTPVDQIQNRQDLPDPAVVGLAGVEEPAVDGEPVLAVAAAVALAAQVAAVGKVTLTLEGEVSRITPNEAEAIGLEHTYRKSVGQPGPFLYSVSFGV